jgi:hypothetical protein
LFTLPDSAVAYASPSVRGEGRPPFSVAWIEPTRSGCAIAGHPVLFGALCVDWEWTYEVFAHEIGHNVSLEYEGHLAVEVLRTDFKLFEGETGQMMSWWANRYAEASGALDAATQAHVADRLSSFTSTYFDHWVAGGQPYVTLDPSHIASMHAALIATYGWEYWRRYVKAWREDATVRTLLDLDGAGPDESARATFVAAAASAAAEADLLTTFRDDWRFPIDEALYVQLLPHFQGIMGS